MSRGARATGRAAGTGPRGASPQSPVGAPPAPGSPAARGPAYTAPAAGVPRAPPRPAPVPPGAPTPRCPSLWALPSAPCPGRRRGHVPASPGWDEPRRAPAWSCGSARRGPAAPSARLTLGAPGLAWRPPLPASARGPEGTSRETGAPRRAAASLRRRARPRRSVHCGVGAPQVPQRREAPEPAEPRGRGGAWGGAHGGAGPAPGHTRRPWPQPPPSLERTGLAPFTGGPVTGAAPEPGAGRGRPGAGRAGRGRRGAGPGGRCVPAAPALHVPPRVRRTRPGGSASRRVQVFSFPGTVKPRTARPAGPPGRRGRRQRGPRAGVPASRAPPRCPRLVLSRAAPASVRRVSHFPEKLEATRRETRRFSPQTPEPAPTSARRKKRRVAR